MRYPKPEWIIEIDYGNEKDTTTIGGNIMEEQVTEHIGQTRMTFEEEYCREGREQVANYNTVTPYMRKAFREQMGYMADDISVRQWWDDTMAGTIRPSKNLEGTTPDASNTQVGGDHYKTMAITPTQYIEANNIPWKEGNAIKYISRHRSKNGKQDIEKAIHYLQLILEDYNTNKIKD